MQKTELLIWPASGANTVWFDELLDWLVSDAGSGMLDEELIDKELTATELLFKELLNNELLDKELFDKERLESALSSLLFVPLHPARMIGNMRGKLTIRFISEPLTKARDKEWGWQQTGLLGVEGRYSLSGAL